MGISTLQRVYSATRYHVGTYATRIASQTNILEINRKTREREPDVETLGGELENM